MVLSTIQQINNRQLNSSMTEHHKAYTTLLLRHRDMLWRMCWKYTGGDRDRCCDLLQEISIALWENYGKLRPQATATQERNWVRWQARSVFYQIQRRHTLATVPISHPIADTVADDTTAQRRELLDEILSSLSSDDRHIVQLYLEGYSGDEIGNKVGLSRDTVYQRMRRIILKLRNSVLLLLILLFTSAIALTVGPHWKHFFFNSKKSEETVADTIRHSEFRIQNIEPPHDTIPPADTVKIPATKRIDTSGILPPFNLGRLLGFNNTPPLPQTIPDDSRITLSCNGSQLTVIGAQGEQIRLYDKRGYLIDKQKASDTCVLQLDPFISSSFYYEYTLYIGDRPGLILRL